MINYALTTEGTSDKVLLRHIDWLLTEHSSVEFNGQWANPEAFISRDRDVATRVSETIRNFPCNLLFVHRDADRDGRSVRVAEIVNSVAALGTVPPLVCVIPVRMTEAWLLVEDVAIRRASGNPRGIVDLDLPHVRELEGVADPKRVLNEALIAASETKGRKRRQFSATLSSAKYRVASLIDDLSVLRRLSGFSAFEQDLRDTLGRNGWLRNP